MSIFLRLRSRATTRIIDCIVLSVAFWLAFLLRFDGEIPPNYFERAFVVWPYVVLLQYLVLLTFRTTNYAWKYIGLREAVRIFLALAAGSSILLAFRLFLADWLDPNSYAPYLRIPIGMILIDLALAFMGITGARALRRLAFERDKYQKRISNKPRVPTLLIGASEAGLLVAKEVEKRPDLGFRLVGFVDDDPTKMGEVVHGVRVLGATAHLGQISERVGAKQAIITIANPSGQDIRRIVGLCESAHLPVRIIPRLVEILDGRVNLTRVRKVSIEDLLRRPVVDLETKRLGRFLRGKRVLVTGAGGSIGSEISRQVARGGPDVLVLLERSEPQLFSIHSELVRDDLAVKLVPCLTDICDREGLETVFSKYRPEVVFHAAAHKHVPMLEWNAVEAVKNNVMGTHCVMDAAERHGIETFVMLSTDKAVNPTSIMGATKRTVEMLLQAKDQHARTKYVSVRFGNVLGSMGSVVPIFKEQIAAGGPVTVTHPDMKRYFMTIPEATQLVFLAASMGNGGEIFVLDMGEPVKIVDLATDLIKLSGLEPHKDIAITFTGIRPGEKLFEELGFDPHTMAKTRHPKIFVLKEEPASWQSMVHGVELLRTTLHEKSAVERLRRVLETIVPEMQPAVLDESTAPVGQHSFISSG